MRTTWTNRHFSYFQSIVRKKTRNYAMRIMNFILKWNKHNAGNNRHIVLFFRFFYNIISVHAFKMRSTTIKKKIIDLSISLCCASLFTWFDGNVFFINLLVCVDTYVVCLVCGYKSGTHLGVYFSKISRRKLVHTFCVQNLIVRFCSSLYRLHQKPFQS